MTNFEAVIQFMRTFGQDVLTTPIVPSHSVCELRVKLIEEELNEFKEAIEQSDVVAATDALADLLYVVYGAGAAFGVDLDKAFAEVHRSNMSKLTKDGQVLRREDGKILKSDQYTPPNLEPIVALGLKK